ncbi:MAG: DNA adenine methylase [Armatimonadetes bacterium]|nr:DNA adenine methylase [Armatimonadota bacterium]
MTEARRLASRDYVTDQLIAYIGNKRKLRDLISEAIALTGLRTGVFFDAFSGSGVVSRLAKSLGFRVIANDWEPYTRCINNTYISLNRPPAFAALGGMDAAFGYLNSLPGQRGYIARHYCPADDERPDLDHERMFFTQANGRRLDAMRQRVFDLTETGQLTPAESDLLTAALVWGTSWCSNTSGVFKGFHRGWGGATQTAWYRIKEPLVLRAPVLLDNSEHNLVFQEDAATLAAHIDCDIAYLDPPYNQHQYGANYHLLNTVALWDKPPIPARVTPGERGHKAAIRRDWRTLRNSAYCRRWHAETALRDLLGRLRARWVLMSYSTDGLIPLERVLTMLSEHGRLSWVHRPYKRYRVSSQRPSARGYNLEFVLAVQMGHRTDPATLQQILETTPH